MVRGVMTHDPASSHFKGWAKPGPVPPGVQQPPELEAGVTLDAISGYFRVFQLRKGHRFSTDDVLTAWYGTTWAPTARTVLDLGSGIGSVGMIAAWRLPGAKFVTVEAQTQSVALARRSACYNGLEARYEIRAGDFRDPAILRAEERFELVLGSPPYFPEGTGVVGDHPQKIACRFEQRGSIVDYCRVASEHLAPGGWFACVFPDAQRTRVDEAAHQAGLSLVRSRPVVLREDEPPLLSLFAWVRAIDLPPAFRRQPWTEPPLIIRDRQGRVHPEYSAVKLSIGFPP
jgi:tRNA1Val (adenine37-N6)-methyltransferase